MSTINTEPIKNVILNCDRCVKDSLFEVSELEQYITTKSRNKSKDLFVGNKTKVTGHGNTLSVSSTDELKKSTVKFLGKKFLFSKKLNNWVTLQATDEGYEFVYVNVEG